MKNEASSYTGSGSCVDKLGSGAPARTNLLPHHFEHLESEGFNPTQILHLEYVGVRSLSEDEAGAMKLKVKGKSSSGLFFPFTATFGQLRADNPPSDENGKPCKYITPGGASSEAYLPEGCRVITEGFKDALAGSLHGGIPTGALAGVSHYAKALKDKKGAGYIILFDSDGWTNPNVFTQLLKAGIFLKGKIQLVPRVEGEPKAGLCEWFKSLKGDKTTAYEALIDEALTPEDFLLTLPSHWHELDEHERDECFKALLRLATSLGKNYVSAVQEMAKEAGISNNEKLRDQVPLAKHYRKLEALLSNRLRLNQLTKDIELDGEAVSLEDLEIELALKHNAQFKYFSQITAALAKNNSYNPVVDYLNTVSAKYGDDTSILYGLAERYFGRNQPIFQAFIEKWLVSAVARALEPGCKVDTALILQGPQGAGKSTFFKVLANNWFDDSVGDVGDKDERLKLHRAWIVEWSELETVFRRKDLSSVKAFLTCSVDHVRPPYGRVVEEMKRQGVIVGTTNDDDFLRDPTGNRRFWVIPVDGAIDIELLRHERDRIWAAAVALYQAGKQWWLTSEEAFQAELINEQFKVRDPWEDAIAIWLKDFFTGVVTTSEILTHCIKIELAKQGRSDQMRVAEILKSQGFRQTPRMHSGKRQRVWIRDSHHDRHNHLDEVVTQVVTAETFGNSEIQNDRHDHHNLIHQNTKKFEEEIAHSTQRSSWREHVDVVDEKVVTGCDDRAKADSVINPSVSTSAHDVVDGCDDRSEVVTITVGAEVVRTDVNGWIGKVLEIRDERALVLFVPDKKYVDAKEVSLSVLRLRSIASS